MNKRLAYFILGSPGAGRREILADILGDGTLEENPVVFLASTEAESALDARLGSVERWTWDGTHSICADVPETAGLVFFVASGTVNPVDQLEAFKEWMKKESLELGRIICVVDCKLAEKNPGLLPWYDACIHFSDIVLLNRRDGVANKWISDFIDRYASQFFPCLFEMVKAGHIKNPALLLEPQARRISQAFDEVPDIFASDVEIEIEDEDEDEEGEESPDEADLPPPVDPYFARRPGGRRIKEIPDLVKFL